MEPMDIVGKSKEDASLPKATMTKIIKEMLPPDVRVARDAQDLLIECCVEFINLISSESNEVCSREEKRTIAPEHVLKALQVLGFSEYIEEVYAAYEQHKIETVHDVAKSVKWGNGAEMTEEQALAEQQRMFAEARARMNGGATAPKQPDPDQRFSWGSSARNKERINVETPHHHLSLNKREETKLLSLSLLVFTLYSTPTFFNNTASLPFIAFLSYATTPTPMAKSLQDSSSKRHFHWTNKVGNEDDHGHDDHALPSLPKAVSDEEKRKDTPHKAIQLQRRKLQAAAISRLRSVLTAFGKNRGGLPLGLGSRVVGTLFGSKKGHVHFALQRDPNSHPAFLIELATPISGLVKEMASGLVRIALECDKEKEDQEKKKTMESKSSKSGSAVRRLLEEPVWRTYCNGKKSGFASRRECGPKEWKVLKAVEPISMGAGVLPCGDEGEDGELMYMRAKFERVVGSRDSEAFYMMNPDSNGAPELSIYLLRV
ncbi:hypothetical protein ACLB2K_044361 [Fragaria x ananassa]